MGIRVCGITVRSLSISRPLVVSMVGICISVVGIRVRGITVRSLSISRPLVVSMVGISVSVVGSRVGSITVVAISMVAIRGVSIRHAIAGISFRLSNNSCEQAQGDNSEGLHLY